MDLHDVARQIEVEHQMLAQLIEGLRITTSWQVQGNDTSRKLSTLRFVVASFQRHLDRLLTLEEHGGYMELVGAADPCLGRATTALQAEHNLFRTQVRQISGRLEALSATDGAELAKACADLLVLVHQIEKHNRKEIDLLQEAFGRESGGEG